MKATAHPAILSMTPHRGLCTPPYRNPLAVASAPLKLNLRNVNGKPAFLGGSALLACRQADGRNIWNPAPQLHAKKYVYPWMARSRIVDAPNRAQARLPARSDVFQ